MRRAAKGDANKTAIVDALRRAGCSVSDTPVGNGFPDIAVGIPVGAQGRTVLLELKDGGKVPSARHLTEAQEKWHAEWRGEAYVIDSLDEALALVGEIRRGLR